MPRRTVQGGSATWEGGTEVPHSKEKQAELGWLHPNDFPSGVARLLRQHWSEGLL